MKVVFEEMRPEHLDQVLKIEEQSFPLPWSANAFYSELQQNSFAYYIVAVVDQVIVGYTGMWIILDEAHITNLAVDPQYRMKGVGRALMLEMIRRGVLMGISKMTLEVRPSNMGARKLYACLGFEEKGIRKCYYSDTNEDAIIMWKHNLRGTAKPLYRGFRALRR